MQIFEKQPPLTEHILALKEKGYQVGFVPTMGALHQGHLSLINKSKKHDDYTVCSIFVNPTQFDDPEDLQHYPRTLEEDIEQLKQRNVQILFAPSKEEMYPSGYEEELPYKFGQLGKVLEGQYRPGHFAGVAQIVSKLLRAVQPHRLYLGQKDYQQYLIINKLIQQMDLEVDTVLCPIVREEDGLAVSSRNVRLTERERQEAPKIYETLLHCKRYLNEKPIEKLQKEAVANLEKVSSFKTIDYFAIVNADNLTPVKQPKKIDNIIACTAVRLKDVRLIDNLFLKRKSK